MPLNQLTKQKHRFKTRGHCRLYSDRKNMEGFLTAQKLNTLFLLTRTSVVIRVRLVYLLDNQGTLAALILNQVKIK